MRHAQLRAFHQVALSGGFSRAGEALSLSQPAISEQVRALERDHDVQLFLREGRSVTLSAVGKQLFRLTERYFEAEAEMVGLLSEARAAPAGKLRLIVDSAHHITGLLTAFRTRYPHVSLHLRTGNSEAVLKALHGYEAEIGLAGAQGFGRDFEVLELGASPIIAFAAPALLAGKGGAMTLAELVQFPLVLRERGSKTRAKLSREAARQGLRLSPAVEVEGREAVREIVASGAGIGFVSRAEFGDDPRLVEIPLAGVDMTMSESLIHLSTRRDVRLIRIFMEFARDHVARRNL